MRAKKLLYVIAYDIVNDKRRNHISKILEKYGSRVNFSVFECMFTDSQLIRVQREIGDLIEPDEDAVIYYPSLLCELFYEDRISTMSAYRFKCCYAEISIDPKNICEKNEFLLKALLTGTLSNYSIFAVIKKFLKTIFL